MLIKKFHACIVAGLMAQSAVSQHFRANSLERKPEDITIEVACAKAKQFFALIDRQDPGKQKYWVMIVEATILGKKVRVWDIWCQKELLVTLDAKSGSILSYNDLKKQADRHYRRNRTNGKFYSSNTVAQTSLRGMATKLNVPATWKMRTITIRGNENPEHPGKGYVGTTFVDASGRVCGSLALDSQDGRLLSFHRLP